MRRREPREIESSVRFLKLKWECSTPFNTTRDTLLQTISNVEVRDKVRAKYFRDAGYSIVQATVSVSSGMKPFFSLKASLLVKIKVAGDVVRAAPKLRALLGARLVVLAQQHCVEFVVRNLVETESVPLIATS